VDKAGFPLLSSSTPMPTEATVLTLEEAQALVRTDDALEAALRKVEALDFTLLRQKLVEEQGLTPELCDEAEGLYRRFLALSLRYPDRKICPTGPIDLFWHAHILDTEAYERDCKALFGRFLHHFPYFGLRGPEDRADLERTFADSVDLFIRHFGIDPTAGDTQARSCRPQNCP
jgi:hypothetical protein